MIGRLAAVGVVAALVMTGCGSHPSRLVVPPPSVTIESQSPDEHSHVLTGPTVDGGSYLLNLLDGAKTVQVHASDLDGHLYRIRTPDGTLAYPTVDLNQPHTVEVALQGASGTDVTVELDKDVAWQIRFSAGISTASIDMGAGTLRGFSALAGISTIDLTAGPPHGTVILSEAGGVSTFALHLPQTTALRVDAAAGAGTVSLFGQSHQGVAAGTSFSTGDADVTDRYVIQAAAGISSLVVDAS